MISTVGAILLAALAFRAFGGLVLRAAGSAAILLGVLGLVVLGSGTGAAMILIFGVLSWVAGRAHRRFLRGDRARPGRRHQHQRQPAR
jgi:membrane protein implicated in regulation of membrane protease activity